MRDYSCPYCGAPIGKDDVEQFEGGSGDFVKSRHDITCPACNGLIHVTAEVWDVQYSLEAATTVIRDGEEVPADPSPEAVARFFKRTPDQIRLIPESVHCEVCHRDGDAECATALDYIKRGWRVAPEFPGVRVTCPNCHGGA